MMCWTLRQVFDADSTVQFCALLLTLLYTGCHASSLFPASDYVPWSSLELIPRRVQGVTVGFDVRTTLEQFKEVRRGFRSGQSGSYEPDEYDLERQVEEVSLCHRTVSKIDNLLWDYGSFIVAHAIRSGVFGETTLDELYADNRRVIPWPEEYKDHPIFLASNSRGIGLRAGAPLTFDAAEERFVAVARECGMVSESVFGDGRHCVPYTTLTSSLALDTVVGMSSVRRGVSARFVKRFGAMTASLVLGHHPYNSTYHRTLYANEHYDPGKDIASAIMGDEEEMEVGDDYEQDMAVNTRGECHAVSGRMINV